MKVEVPPGDSFDSQQNTVITAYNPNDSLLKLKEDHLKQRKP